MLCAEKLHSGLCMTADSRCTWSCSGCTKGFQSSAWHLDNRSPFISDGNWTYELPGRFQNYVHMDQTNPALLPCPRDMIFWLRSWEEKPGKCKACFVCMASERVSNLSVQTDVCLEDKGNLSLQKLMGSLIGTKVLMLIAHLAVVPFFGLYLRACEWM